MKTLTERGMEKIAALFGASLSHAVYEHDGTDEEIPILSVSRNGSCIRVYVFFDSDISGSVGNVRLVDVDGEVVAWSDRTFIMQDGRGFYTAFKYNFVEVEEEENA